MLEIEKRKRKLTFKRANQATWGKDEVDSDDEEEKHEEALLSLMAFDQDSIEVVNSILSSSSDDQDDLDGLHHKLYNSLVKAI